MPSLYELSFSGSARPTFDVCVDEVFAALETELSHDAQGGGLHRVPNFRAWLSGAETSDARISGPELAGCALRLVHHNSDRASLSLGQFTAFTPSEWAAVGTCDANRCGGGRKVPRGVLIGKIRDVPRDTRCPRSRRITGTRYVPLLRTALSAVFGGRSSKVSGKRVLIHRLQKADTQLGA